MAAYDCDLMAVVSYGAPTRSAGGLNKGQLRHKFRLSGL
jgi:hypothetical protein